jgi:8-oxo-dGTP pyrophosphatase MutT (NUDIX family)
MTPPPAHPSATLVLLRDGASGVEILMVRRNAHLAFHGGAWVFPGGRVDPEDREKAGSDDWFEAARHAAVREAREEAGVEIDAALLVPFAEWVTPEILPKRFRTWFFAAPAGRAGTDGQVGHDGSGEVVEHSWVTADRALALQAAGEIDLPHPTYVTLLQLREHRTTEAALAALTLAPAGVYRPRLVPLSDAEGGVCCVLEEDAAFADGNLDAPGPRHRLYARKSEWKYIRDPSP